MFRRSDLFALTKEGQVGHPGSPERDLQALKLQRLKSMKTRTQTSGLKSLYENSILARFCSARLQAGISESSRCPPEGGRYMNQSRVLTQSLKPRPPKEHIHVRISKATSAPSPMQWFVAVASGSNRIGLVRAPMQVTEATIRGQRETPSIRFRVNLVLFL